MSRVSKVGDICIGVCPKHGGPLTFCSVLVSGAASVLIDSQSCGNMASVGISSCGHPTIAVTGSSTVTAETYPIHRIGDIDINPGSGVMVTGSGDVSAG